MLHQKSILVFFASFLLIHGLFAQMDFVENKGQWHPDVAYRGNFQTGSFFVEKNGFSVIMHSPDDLQKISSSVHGISKEIGQQITLHSFKYKMELLHASTHTQVIREKQQNTYNNYFYGNDSKNWASECHLFQSITYPSVYPNIDMRYYSEGDHVKYDFILHPGANSNRIIMQYDGPEKIYVQNEELIIKTAIGDVKELKPYCYQQDEYGKRTTISCKYVVSGNKVYFQLGRYDIKQKLIIDPSIVFSSFTGSSADNWGYTATPGPDKSFFAGGIVFNNGYQVSTGAYQTTYNGGQTEISFFPPPNENLYLQLPGHDMAIFKFSPDGSQRVYATYLGGSGNEQPHSMICDQQGNLIVAGRSSSFNFPAITNLGAGGGYDVVITKLNARGTGIVGSVKIGGSNDDGVNIRSKYAAPDGADRIRRFYGDDARSEVIIDAAGNIILSSCTQSSNFPVNGNSLNSTGAFGGGFQDGLLLKFNASLNNYLFGSYLGGSGDDACFVNDINPVDGVLYIAGGTTSTDFPGNKSGALYPSYQGGTTDGFVCALKTDGSGIIKTTYMGTGSIDVVYGLKFDKSGFPYIMGTTSGSWPVLRAAYSISSSSQFVAKLKPDLSAFEYSTVFGTGSSLPNISPIAFMVDRCENLYISGWGGGINQEHYGTGNTDGLQEKNPLSGIPPPDGKDFYFMVLSKNADSLLFASHFGQYGGESDHVDGGTSRYDKNGIIYQAMCANCGGGTTFPTTPGAWSRYNGSSNCNQAAVKIEMNYAGVAASIQPAINAIKNDTSGCVPFTVVFSDTLQKGKTYYWDFGNGLKDTTRAPNFTTSTSYDLVQTYTVRVIAEDSSTCNIRDTAYIDIKAGNDSVLMNFKPVKRLPCNGLDFDFINLSESVLNTSFQSNSFTWDFGDGSPTVIAAGNVSHTFSDTGFYNITLTLNDIRFCNAPTKKTIRLHVTPKIIARLLTEPSGCAPYSAVFINRSETSNVKWEFDDGFTATTDTVRRLYTIPGNYQVRLIAIDSNTCNKRDTTNFFSFFVSGKPNASFDWSPNPPLVNTPIQFNNLTPDAVNYVWQFGDGDSSLEMNPIHQYNTTDVFNAFLVAVNEYQCRDTFPLQVRAVVNPLLDVPTAFSPGQSGANSTVYVKGFGIGKMDWRIYNRWGQLVFRSSNFKQGWNGMINGKLQAMDVYPYTLEVEFTDGQKLSKTGDITLIR